jgi:hypothetical protein
VSATPCSSVYPTARRGGLRGAGGNSTDSSTAVNSPCRHRRMLWAPLQSFHTIGHALLNEQMLPEGGMFTPPPRPRCPWRAAGARRHTGRHNVGCGVKSALNFLSAPQPSSNGFVSQSFVLLSPQSSLLITVMADASLPLRCLYLTLRPCPRPGLFAGLRSFPTHPPGISENVQSSTPEHV